MVIAYPLEWNRDRHNGVQEKVLKHIGLTMRFDCVTATFLLNDVDNLIKLSENQN